MFGNPFKRSGKTRRETPLPLNAGISIPEQRFDPGADCEEAKATLSAIGEHAVANAALFDNLQQHAYAQQEPELAIRQSRLLRFGNCTLALVARNADTGAFGFHCPLAVACPIRGQFESTVISSTRAELPQMSPSE